VLRLPIQVYLDTEAPDSANVMEEPAARMLEALGVRAGEPDRAGRRWFGRALAIDLRRRWPTTVQFVYV